MFELSAILAAVVLMSPAIYAMLRCSKLVIDDSNEMAEINALSRYFVSTFRENGFLDEQTIKILSSKKRALYYGVDFDDERDRKAAKQAVTELYIKEQ